MTYRVHFKLALSAIVFPCILQIIIEKKQKKTLCWLFISRITPQPVICGAVHSGACMRYGVWDTNHLKGKQTAHEVS